MKNRIASLRRRIGLSQKELGEKLGVVQTTVSAWELGKNEPDNETLQKLADIFAINAGYIAGYESKPIRRTFTYEELEEHRKKWGFENLEPEDYQDDEEWQNAHYKAELEEQEAQRERYFEDLDFEENGEGMHFEAFLFNKACDFMSREQRQRALNGLKALFPKAFKNLSDPD